MIVIAIMIVVMVPTMRFAWRDAPALGVRTIISAEDGDRVRTTLNSTWIDATVGLGHTPRPVRGLLGNPAGDARELLTVNVAVPGDLHASGPQDRFAVGQISGRAIDNQPRWLHVNCHASGILAIMTGTLLLVALSVMIVSPQFGEWLAARAHLSNIFVMLWPYMHWSLAALFTIWRSKACTIWLQM